MAPVLQITIAAYGEDAVERIAALSHPEVDGVEYVVSWQKYDRNRIPENLRQRNDFHIYTTDTIGSSINRNNAFEHASADFVLVSDDDLSYTEENIQNVLNAIKTHGDYDFLTFKYHTEYYNKFYPDTPVEVKTSPKGYYTTAIEILLNRKRFIERTGNINDMRFNLNFGISGRLFICAEDDMLMAKLLKKGYKGLFVPEYITTHQGSTTSDRTQTTKEFISTKGALFLYSKPRSWFARMLAHAYRSAKNEPEKRIGFFKYCGWWLAGVWIALKYDAFKED